MTLSGHAQVGACEKIVEADKIKNMLDTRNDLCPQEEAGGYAQPTRCPHSRFARDISSEGPCEDARI